MEKLKTQNPDGFCRKVMTDDQVEQLRKQIAVYAVICEQLVDMHKAFTAQQDLSGTKTGSVYGDLMASGGSKVTARQRWTPTSLQLEILERIYDEANGTPGKHRVKEITIELSQHGQVTETNVYNWFQNRRARSKRKQSVPARNITESDLEPSQKHFRGVGQPAFQGCRPPLSVQHIDHEYELEDQTTMTQETYAELNDINPPLEDNDAFNTSTDHVSHASKSLHTSQPLPSYHPKLEVMACETNVELTDHDNVQDYPLYEDYVFNSINVGDTHRLQHQSFRTLTETLKGGSYPPYSYSSFQRSSNRVGESSAGAVAKAGQQ